MKKALSFLLIITILLTTISLISCSNKYGVNKKLEAEIRQALEGKYCSEDGGTYFWFSYIIKDEKVIRTAYFDGEEYKAQSYKNSYVVKPDCIYDGTTTIYYIYKNGQITYFDTTPPKQ